MLWALAGGVVVVVAAVAAVVAVKIWIARAEARRRQAVAGLAGRLGLEYSPVEVNCIVPRFMSFRALDRGDERQAGNVIFGQFQGREAYAFDYNYKIVRYEKGRRHELNFYLSAAVVCLDCQLPGLLIRPRNLLDRLAAAVGHQDIEFESHEFSSKFHVQAADRKFAYDVVNAQTMQYLLGCGGWSLELSGSAAIIYTGKRWKVPDFALGLEVLTGFVEHIPHFVWKQLGSAQELARQEREGQR